MVARHWNQSRRERPPRSSSCLAAEVHRSGYAQSPGVSSDAEMKSRGFLALVLIGLLPFIFVGQILDPAKLLTMPTDTWPTYNGDYSGRRYSPLSQINATNVRSLGIAWMYRTNAGAMRGVPGVQIKSTPLEVNGILYFTVPDHVWAV